MLFEQQAVAPVAGPVTKANNIVVVSLAGLEDEDVAQLRMPGANQLTVHSSQFIESTTHLAMPTRRASYTLTTLDYPLTGANQLKCRFTYPAAGGASATTESNATLVSATSAECLLPQQPAGTTSDDGALSLGVGNVFAAPLTSASTTHLIHATALCSVT